MNHLKITTAIVLLYYTSGTWQHPVDDLSITWTDKAQMYYQDKYNKEITFYDTFAGENNHTFTIFKCSDFSASYPGRCTLTTRTHYFGNHVYTKNCNVQAPAENNKFVKYRGLTFLRGDRVLLFWKENSNDHGLRMVFQVIFTNDCRKSDFIYEDSRLSLEDIPHSIIRNRDSFDIIAQHPQNCLGSAYCKVTYNYNGEPVFSVPKPFSNLYLPEPNSKIDISGAYPMSSKHPEEVVIIAHLGNTHSIFSEDVYSSALGWIKAEELTHFRYTYSNTNGFSTICWQMEYQKTKFRCRWLDGHRELNLDFGYFGNNVLFPKIHNLENGNILLIMGGRSVDGGRVIVEETLDDDKCKRLADIFVGRQPETVEFSLADRDRLCLSFVTSSHHQDLYNSEVDIFHYNFTTTCTKIQNNFDQENKKCANKFLVA